MKALMFGWEFPPHILGGLGTASYGLTKGMAECGDIDITLSYLNHTETRIKLLPILSELRIHLSHGEM